MSTRTCVVAIGQEAAGDDGVGLVVLGELERRGFPAGIDLVRAVDPLDLVAIFESGVDVVLVDAVVASPAGLVVELGVDDLSQESPQPASSHGIGTARAIELARSLSSSALGDVRVVAITIRRPERYRVGLSPEVAAAVSEAADRVLALLGA